jgi:mono/diheme cytochrome c family protein
MRTSLILLILAIGLTGAASWIAAQEKGAVAAGSAPAAANNSSPAASASPDAKSAASAPPVPARSAAEDRIEGEKRFRANCSRCHQTPHKFPPRAVATIIRHMRVRATITDDDARLILKYMSQ